jgi:hypothetical protein
MDSFTDAYGITWTRLKDAVTGCELHGTVYLYQSDNGDRLCNACALQEQAESSHP